MQKKIILTGGGTAGHITPLLALIPQLKELFAEIHFFGRSVGLERELTANSGVIYHAIDPPRFDRSKPLSAFGIPFRLFAAARKAGRLIRCIQPSVIFAKGGYVSLPAALSNGRVPLVIHESDTSLGLANRLTAKRADVVCSSFPLPPYKGKKILRTGSPIRQEIYSGEAMRARSECGFSGKKRVLLVVGGSLGAAPINSAVDNELDRLLEKYDVLHIRGRGNGCDRRDGYFPIEFSPNIYDYLALADTALTRGGGNTIFELGALHVPMLIVPLPKGASRGDQLENARVFAENGLAMTARQEELEGNVCALLDRLECTRDRMIDAQKVYSFDGTDLIIEILKKYAVT